MKKTNNIRNANVDESRIAFWKERPTLFKLFSSSTNTRLLQFVMGIKYRLIAIILLSTAQGLVEGAKAAFVLLLIKAVVSDSNEINKLLDTDVATKFSVVEEFIQKSPQENLIILSVLGVVALSLITAIGKVVVPWLTERATVNLLRNIREEAIDKILSFDVEYFSEAKSGELLFLMTSETNRFSSLIVVAVNSITYFVQLIVLLGMLMYMFWELTLVVMIIGVTYFFIHIGVDRMIKKKSWEVNLLQNNLAHFFHEMIYGIRIIKIGGLEDREKDRYIDEHSVYESKSVDFAVVRGFSNFYQELLLIVVLMVVMFSMIVIGDNGIVENNPDQILGFLFLLLRALHAAVNLQSSRTNLISAYGPLSRVMNLIGKPILKKKNTDSERKKINGKITQIDVRNVHFSYKGSSVLNGVDCSFYVGQRTAIVGPSGSGKSTLLDIISSILIPSEGNVLINGEDLCELDVSDYKSKLGYMNQEPIIFHDSVKSNITYINPAAGEKDIVEALEMSDAARFVNELSGGVEHGIGERGQTLSGGQRQRIGLARIFIQNSEIIFLDEATNALDYESEKKIYKNIAKISDDNIVIVVAHRLSAIKDFDNIIMLNNGIVVEQGAHDELMENKSYYYKLFSSQESNTY